MTAFAARVLRTVRALRLVSPGMRIGVAVSGGPDSTALLLVMLELAPSLGATIDCVVHVNHGLRGTASDDDASSVEALAARAGLAFVGRSGDVRGLARQQRCSLESAGHRVRRQVFAEVRSARGLDVVATGHTLDDQAETVLLRLVRGAGASGLRGMSPRRAGVIRPLIATPRRDIEAYLASRGVVARDDGSNRDLSIPRNRIRHELLPLLARHYSPRIRESLARLAALVAADDDHFVAEAARATRQIEVVPGGLLLGRSALAGMSAPAVRRVAQAILKRLGVAETARRVERLAGVIVADEGQDATIGTISVSNQQGRIQVTRGTGRNRPRPGGIVEGAADVVALVPGRTARFGPWNVAADDVAGIDVRRPADEAAIDADQVDLPLAIRARRPGDRFRPLGGAGRRKLQDILVDRKVPRASRDTTPIVVDARDRIVWVAGHVVAHDARVTAATTRMLLLTLRPAGGAV